MNYVLMNKEKKCPECGYFNLVISPAKLTAYCTNCNARFTAQDQTRPELGVADRDLRGIGDKIVGGKVKANVNQA